MQKEIGWLLQEKYSGRLTNSAKKDIQKLKAGEPVDYLIGFMEFLDCKIDLSKRPLIPRLETEYWTERAIDELKVIKLSSYKVLDMFSGSGCVGVAILKHCKNSELVFSDSENNCIEQIKINCEINNITKNRYEIIQSDVFSDISGKFDYIFANPPYIAIKRKNKIQKSALKYEPNAALFGGEDGLFYIRKFLTDAKNFLNNNGKVYMEFDSIQKKEIEKLLNPVRSQSPKGAADASLHQTSNGVKKIDYKKYEFQKDQYGKWRYVVIG